MPSPLVQSPVPSPPRRALPLSPNQPPPNSAGRMDSVGASLFTEAQVQRMATMEQTAPLLYPRGPQSQGDSSSLPHDAIQAEVARQLAGMRAMMEESRGMVERTQAEKLEASRQAQALGVGGGFSGSRVVEGIGSEAPAAPMAAASTSLPRAPSAPQPLSSSPYPPPPPPVEAQGVRGLLSGLLGRSRSQSPPPGSRPQTEPTSANQQTFAASAQS